jgi:hypothetical protein
MNCCVDLCDLWALNCGVQTVDIVTIRREVLLTYINIKRTEEVGVTYDAALSVSVVVWSTGSYEVQLFCDTALSVPVIL